MKRAVILLAFALLVLHQDAWLWGDRGIVMGFLPSGLAYHVVFSFLSAAVWALAIKFAWPSEWERWGDSGDDTP